MKKSFALLAQTFESSSGLTPQFKTFFDTFKKELTTTLKANGCTGIEVNRGHFYASGFFTTAENKIYYFSLSDVRGSFDGEMLYRTAKDYKDFTGGINQYVKLDKIKDLTIF